MKTRTQIGPRWTRENESVELIDGRRTTAGQIRQVQAAELLGSLRKLKAHGLLTSENHDAALVAVSIDSFVLAAKTVVREN